MAATQTKRSVVERLIGDFERWLEQSQIMDTKTIYALRQKNNITTGRIVAIIEKFALPAHKLGQLDQYVTSEIKKAQFLSFKTKQMFEGQPQLQQRMVAAAQRLKQYNPADHAYIVRQLDRICSVLLM